MTRPEWWTDADQAELDIALWTIVEGFWDATPEERRPLWELLLDWHHKRCLLSKAEYYRRRHLERSLNGSR